MFETKEDMRRFERKLKILCKIHLKRTLYLNIFGTCFYSYLKTKSHYILPFFRK
jgi:hypothetical protein